MSRCNLNFVTMKNVLQFVAILLATLIISSCGNNNVSEINLIPVKSGKDFQYIDKEGKIVINPQFSQATVFRNGLALVKTSSNEPKWGFITEDGKFAIMANYKEATVFSDDIAWVVSENAAPTAINAKGEIKITLQDAQTVKIFKEGLAAYSVIDSSGQKWGFVDKEGKIKINPQFSNTGNFNNGKCAVENSDGKWGYIDKEGKIVINYQFDEAKEFVSGKAIVVSGGKSGLIDESGKYVINPQFSNMTNDNDMFLIEQDGKWGWCDKEGKITINPQFGAAFPFLDNDIAAVQSGKSFGYIDKEGKIVINPQFDIALSFNGKIALVSSSNKVGFIDKEGKYVINPQFDDVSQDLVVYMLNGSSKFESIETDYFNIGVITDRIKKDITDKTVAGMNFTTPISTVLSKYKKSEQDFSKYSSENKIITYEKLSNDATLDFYVLGNPWTQSSDGWFGYNYTFNTNFNPTGFAYRINLTGNGNGKEDDVFKAIQTAFNGYTKDVEQSTEDNIVLKNSFQTVRIFQENGIMIVVQPLVNNNPQEESGD